MKTSAGKSWELIFMPTIIAITYFVVAGWLVEQILEFI
jgi:flagellar biosynthesis protein FliQ